MDDSDPKPLGVPVRRSILKPACEVSLHRVYSLRRLRRESCGSDIAAAVARRLEHPLTRDSRARTWTSTATTATTAIASPAGTTATAMSGVARTSVATSACDLSLSPLTAQRPSSGLAAAAPRQRAGRAGEQLRRHLRPEHPHDRARPARRVRQVRSRRQRRHRVRPAGACSPVLALQFAPRSQAGAITTGTRSSSLAHRPSARAASASSRWTASTRPRRRLSASAAWTCTAVASASTTQARRAPTRPRRASTAAASPTTTAVRNAIARHADSTDRGSFSDRGGGYDDRRYDDRDRAPASNGTPLTEPGRPPPPRREDDYYRRDRDRDDYRRRSPSPRRYRDDRDRDERPRRRSLSRSRSPRRRSRSPRRD